MVKVLIVRVHMLGTTARAMSSAYFALTIWRMHRGARDARVDDRAFVAMALISMRMFVWRVRVHRFGGHYADGN
jgi:hypothetical protein